MTSILKVLTEYCEKYVDDIRLQELLQTDTPLYARKMWDIFLRRYHSSIFPPKCRIIC